MFFLQPWLASVVFETLILLFSPAQFYPGPGVFTLCPAGQIRVCCFFNGRLCSSGYGFGQIQPRMSRGRYKRRDSTFDSHGDKYCSAQQVPFTYPHNANAIKKEKKIFMLLALNHVSSRLEHFHISKVAHFLI